MFGCSAFGRQHNVIKSNLPLSLKMKVYYQCISPVLTYELETWNLTKTLELKLQKFQMERIILDISLEDRKKASWIRE